LNGRGGTVFLVRLCTDLSVAIFRGVLGKHYFEFEDAKTPLAMKQMLEDLKKYLTSFRSTSSRYAPCIVANDFF